jgi:glyoxylase-like metal-dependent hydrolase (beta-lactamase superfamily II)
VTAVQLADGVWRLPTAPADLVNSFLLADDDGSLTLVDAGLRRADRRVLAALEQLGRAPGDVQRILMTHAHADHAGGLAAAQRATGGLVLVHETEAPYLRELEFDVAAFTHGAEVRTGARTALRAFLAGRPS